RRHTRSKRDWSSDVCSSDLQRLSAEINGLRTIVGVNVACGGRNAVSANINISGLTANRVDRDGDQKRQRVSIWSYCRLRHGIVRELREDQTCVVIGYPKPAAINRNRCAGRSCFWINLGNDDRRF